jgi:starch synthase
MKINIAASHRFHLLDLARELEKHGHEVRFYSYVPTRRAIKFGLKKKNSKSLFFLMLPFLALVKISKRTDWSLKLNYFVLDNYLSWFMPKCDIFIGLGTVYKNSFITAKEKYNAMTILEWGSKHIYAQEEAITNNSGANKQADFFIERSIKGYNISDFISIPSSHVKQSFLKYGIKENKLMLNPYGVDLKMFPKTQLNEKDNFDVLMVGNWSYTKGSDFIIKSLKESNLTFLHVGSIQDIPFPNLKNMHHIDPVDQSELKNYYSKAKTFILPSRTEGLAMVQAQAIACGLPLVCSKETGGSDLRSLLSDKKWIIELEDQSDEEIIKSVNEALLLAKSQIGLRDYAKSDISNLTWKSYGERYNKNLKKLNDENVN